MFIGKARSLECMQLTEIETPVVIGGIVHRVPPEVYGMHL